MTYPENTPSVDDMLNMSTGDLAQMPVELLATLQAELDHASKQLKAATARFSAALEVRYANRAAEARRACGKDTGTVRLVDGDYTVVADLPKRVDWDQEKLAQIARNIADSGEDPAEFIDTKLSVSERKYGALPGAWRDGFAPARTVKVGALKVTLEPAEARK
ncbi:MULTISPECIES: hypothetical protein [unclassified Aliiroseovarius]|uniref:hypothetical protein n=1 Tax=unclassified Aliiroseovarius TaxID=2623558 RepID=UPI0015692DB0|nr:MULTISPECIES: hypothetical protein [unclassified Aliiroseovarius]NRP30805.1 hypothetical protein [Aliiroseovarius sp. xm-m-314]NRP80447.1 hypothetical protein [Aliiroseovarius sp. xm-v-209]